MLARVRSRRPDHDPSTAASVDQRVVRKPDVVLSFTQWTRGGVFGQAAVAMLDSEDLRAFFEKRKRRGTDDRVGCWRGATGEQDCDSLDVEIMVGQLRHGVTLVVSERSCGIDTCKILRIYARSPRYLIFR